jgi:hypothetical protein
VWHVAILGNDLEALDGFGIADDVVEVDGTIFLYPGCLLVWMSWGRSWAVNYHGSS